MTGKERMAAAMSAHKTGIKPDRTPVMCQLSMGYMYKNAGIPPTRFWMTNEGRARAFIDLADEYGFDGILLPHPGIGDNPPAEISRTERDGGVEIAYADGGRYFYPPDEFPACLNNVGKSLSLTIDDVSPADIRDFETPSYWPDLLRTVIKERGETLSIHGEVGTAFERTLMLFGNCQDGLIAIMDDESKFAAIMERVNRQVIQHAAWQCNFPIDAMKLSSPFAGGSFISRAMYERLVLPFERAVIDFVHKRAGIPCYIHTCGSIGDRLDLILATGTDGIECLDPPPLGNVDFGKAVEFLKGKAFIKGNLDSVNELTRPADEVIAIAKRRIELARPLNGAYILSSACSVSPITPPASLRALKQAVL